MGDLESVQRMQERRITEPIIIAAANVTIAKTNAIANGGVNGFRHHDQAVNCTTDFTTMSKKIATNNPTTLLNAEPIPFKKCWKPAH